ncbi:sugar phosphate isomerase/epimerase family protein [Actinoallomurus sp. CA-142502]|uniref:sugar phosphate isomerase/epimerase family protein n=1 Tax=Actinoallomurus sp. CA-142502 TaxID=3239885 RepID=UPI003D90551D
MDGCVRHGLEAIGLWREHVADHGLEATAALVRSAGQRVSSLCRGGFFNEPDRREQNRRAIDEAAVLEAPASSWCLAGCPPDPATSPAPYAAERGVRLAIEAPHPMYCADRSVVSTLAQALDLAPPEVGVVVDRFHL